MEGGEGKRGIGKHDKACFHFGERFYIWECPSFENIGDGKSKDSFWNKKKKKLVGPFWDLQWR
jgi:hypothetical protein